MRPMKIDEIGGGKVLRLIRTKGGAELPRGTVLSHDQLAEMNTNNRNALIENNFIQVFPAGVSVPGAAAAQVTPGELMVVPRGFGKYDVIRGTVIAVGLTKEEAFASIGKAVDEAKPPRSRKRAA